MMPIKSAGRVKVNRVPLRPGALPRRGFLTGASAAGLLSPLLAPLLAHAQIQAQTQPPPAGTPDSQSAASMSTSVSGEDTVDSATLKAATDSAQHLTVEVRINGAGPYQFVVDTGSERSVLSDRIVATLGLEQGSPVLVKGLTRSVGSYLVTVKELSFGPFSRSNLSLPVLSRSNMGADGILGLDAINGSRVTFDFKNHALRIEQPRTRLSHTSENGGDVIIIRAPGPGGRLRSSNCSVDGAAATMFIDTGAEVSIGNTALRAAMARARGAGVPTLGMLLVSGMTGGETTGPIIPVREIRVQNLMFTDGTLVITDTADFDSWDLTNKSALLIGMDFLRKFSSVTIDYRLKQIRFELAEAAAGPPGIHMNRT